MTQNKVPMINVCPHFTYAKWISSFTVACFSSKITAEKVEKYQMWNVVKWKRLLKNSEIILKSFGFSGRNSSS